MSLHIYFVGDDNIPDLPVKKNIESWFASVVLDGCSYDKEVLKSIEKGTFVDNTDFLDRFGRTLSCELLSTGTKGVLLVYHSTDSIIYGVELGRNALLELVKRCDRGHLLLPAKNYYLECTRQDRQVDVVCKGVHFSSLNALAEYMMEDAPYEVDIRE